MLPLSLAPEGARLRLIEIRSGRRLRQRLIDMGLVPGVEFSVRCNNGHGIIVALGDTRLALGRGMSHKILVRPVEGD